ncbi:MAG: glycosyl transferase family 2 [Rhodobacteraceae bacterium]|nr:glycosyl transferase family 2 [Paracoccaceae bacterium]
MTMHTSVDSGDTKIAPDLSVIVIAEGDGKGLADLLSGYRAAIDALGQTYELLFVFDHASKPLAATAAEIAADWPEFTTSPQRPWVDEDAALKFAIERTTGANILTLPGWPEIDPSSIGDLVAALDTADVAAGQRTNLTLSGLQKLRARILQGMVGMLFKKRFADIFCRARAGHSEVLRDVAELGVRQHFLPLVAATEGYRVQEVPVRAAPKAATAQLYQFKPFAHVSALVDLLTLFVGLKFLKRPLRFFGSVGVPLIAVGTLMTLFLVIQRLFFEYPLGDRPALVFAVLLLVLGIQIVALGLVGEIIIFASTRRLRTYEIDTIIRGRLPDDAADLPPAPDPSEAAPSTPPS